MFFMWEKAVRTHDKPLWIRLPSRLPVGKFKTSEPHDKQDIFCFSCKGPRKGDFFITRSAQ